MSARATPPAGGAAAPRTTGDAIVAVPGTPGRAGTGGSGGRWAGRPEAVRSLVLLALVSLAALAVPLLGPGVALHGTGEAAAPGLPGIAVLRALLFVALCVPVGEAYADRLAARLPGVTELRPPPCRALPAALVGFLAALLLAGIVAAGNLVPRHLSDLDLDGLYRTRDGVLAFAEVNAFLLAMLWAGSRRATCRLLPAAAVVVAEALRAHPPTEATELLGSALTAVHLTCALLWAGGLWQVLRTLRHRPAPAGGAKAGAALLAAYARPAVVLLAALSLTGLVSALRRMPPSFGPDLWVTTAYGRTLLAKALLVAVAAGLALVARLRLTRAEVRTAGLRGVPGHPVVRYDALAACAPARVEVAVLAVVVVVSAVLTALPVPLLW